MLAATTPDDAMLWFDHGDKSLSAKRPEFVFPN